MNRGPPLLVCRKEILVSGHRLVAGSFVILLAAAALLRAADSPREGWKAVDDAMERGLPKTAIENLKPIIESAKAEQRYAEAI